MTIRIDRPEIDLPLDAHDPAPTPNDGALVQWMDPKPLSLGAAGVSATAAAAFAFGAVAAVGLLALLHWLTPAPIRRR